MSKRTSAREGAMLGSVPTDPNEAHLLQTDVGWPCPHKTPDASPPTAAPRGPRPTDTPVTVTARSRLPPSSLRSLVTPASRSSRAACERSHDPSSRRIASRCRSIRASFLMVHVGRHVRRGQEGPPHPPGEWKTRRRGREKKYFPIQRLKTRGGMASVCPSDDVQDRTDDFR